MANLDVSLPVPQSQSGTASASLGFHWLIGGLGILLVGGLYLVSWAANHAQVDDPFVSPWAIPIYAGFIVFVIVLIGTFLRNRAAGYSGASALPEGYPVAVLGAALFLCGLLAGLFGQQAFGAPVDLEVFTSPILLLIYLGTLLMVSAPLRSAWALEPESEAPGWRSLGPAILSVGLTLSTLTFMTQFAHPLTEILAAQDPNVKEPVYELYAMNADGTRQTRLTISADQGGWGSAWSPDGSKIVFSSLSSSSAGTYVELYLMNADGSGRTQLTNSQRGNYLPAWSPDGSRIAFISQIGSTDTAEVHVINVDGSDERELTTNEAWEYGVSWSPDSTQLVFGSDRDGAWQIYTMNADGSDQKPLPNPAHGNAPDWSPDGKQIVFTSDRDGEDEIFVMEADGSNQTRLTASDVWVDNPHWSPDGRQIIFSSRPDGPDDIFVMDADGTHVRNLTQSSGGGFMFLAAWSPDGKTILYDKIDNPVNPPALTQPLGIASLLLQAALLMGLLLLMVRRWRLPFGALTFVMTMNAALMSLIADQYVFVAAALAAGLLADLLLWLLKPSIFAPVRWYSFAFLVPLFFYGLYFFTVFRTRTVIWSPHLWMGLIVEAGMVGLLLGFLVRVSAGASSDQR